LVAWEDGRVAGLARSLADADLDASECAVIIRADLRQKGLASQLLQALLAAIGAQGIRQAVLNFPADRARMLNIAKDLEFAIGPMPADAALLRAVKVL
jgi:acetyltransferase